jgi:hypothetical protein
VVGAHLAVLDEHGSNNVIGIANSAQRRDVAVVYTSVEVNTTNRMALERTMNVHPSLLYLDGAVGPNVIGTLA